MTEIEHTETEMQKRPWLASQTDMLADDWYEVE